MHRLTQRVCFHSCKETSVVRVEEGGVSRPCGRCWAHVPIENGEGEGLWRVLRLERERSRAFIRFDENQ